MPRQPAMSRAESQAARIVWNLGSASVREVHEKFTKQRRAEFKTVQTYLRRLEAKGYLRSRIVKGTRIYRPRARPSRVMAEAFDDFLKRLFGGQTNELLHYLIEEGRITRDDVENLQRLLTRLEAEQREEEDEP